MLHLRLRESTFSPARDSAGEKYRDSIGKNVKLSKFVRAMKEKEAGENAGIKIVEIAGKKVRYIDPLTDWGFKRLFGTEANKEILSGFLEVLFPDKVIRDIRYLNPEQLGLTREDRKSVFDVCCKTDSGDDGKPAFRVRGVGDIPQERERAEWNA